MSTIHVLITNHIVRNNTNTASRGEITTLECSSIAHWSCLRTKLDVVYLPTLLSLKLQPPTCSRQFLDMIILPSPPAMNYFFNFFFCFWHIKARNFPPLLTRIFSVRKCSWWKFLTEKSCQLFGHDGVEDD